MCNSLLFATETCKRERHVVTASSTQAVKHLKLMTNSSIAQVKKYLFGRCDYAHPISVQEDAVTKLKCTNGCAAEKQGQKYTGLNDRLK